MQHWEMAFESKYIDPMPKQQNWLHPKTDDSFEMSEMSFLILKSFIDDIRLNYYF